MVIKSLDSFSGAENVLLRCDYNVPIQDDTVVDDYRIRASIPTINELLSKSDQILITTHRGRPGGQRDEQLSTAVIAEHLDGLLDTAVGHVDQPIPQRDDLPGPDDHPVVLLENIRFVEGETENADRVAKDLGKLADAYVNDAFGAAHRQHSSTHAVQNYLPSFKGRRIEQEMAVYETITGTENTLYFVLGGAKLKTKLGLIKAFTDTAETIFVGGAMMFPFFEVNEWSTGQASVSKQDYERARQVQDQVSLPQDVVVADDKDNPSRVDHVQADSIPSHQHALDVGPRTIDHIMESIDDADYVVWNGPLGYYENPAFAKATEDLAARLADDSADVVIGGGDTGAVVNDLSLTNKFYHVSSGGGAFLTLMENGELPAFESPARKP